MVELVHSAPGLETDQRITRIMMECKVLRSKLTRGEARARYLEIEAARDTLSEILDRADGKS